MADTMSSGVSSNDAQQSEQKNLPPPSRRRFKPQLSCNLCRTRKLRCDRKQPCQNCLKKGLADSCTFVKADPQERPRAPRPMTNAELQERIDQLEDIVKSYITFQSNDSLAAGAENQPCGVKLNTPVEPSMVSHTDSNLGDGVSQVAESIGRLDLDHEEPSYVGNTHWKSVLNDLSELADHIENLDDPPNQGQEAGLDLLLGQRANLTAENRLQFIPPRDVADRIIEYFMSAIDLSMAIHRPTFKKEYERFWDDPDSVSMAWLALLYGLLSVTTTYAISAEINIPQIVNQPTDSAALYRVKAAECLVLSNYTRPGQYTVEALLLYLIAEWIRLEEPSEFGVSIICSIIVHAAMRLGYHRDASHYPERLTPFQAEMRRRVWSIIRQIDFFVCTSTGLPRHIKDEQTDVKLPSNIQDEDFDEDSRELPVPKPVSPHTRLGFNILKLKTFLIRGKIEDLVNSTRPYPYSEVLQMDRLLHDAFDWSPELWSVTNATDCEVPDLTLRKGYLRFMQVKARCELHRNFLIPALSNPQFEFSKNACIEASIQILLTELNILDACRPGMRFRKDRWKVAFITAYTVMMAILVLSVEITRGSGTSYVVDSMEGTGLSVWNPLAMLDLIERVRTSWDHFPDPAFDKFVRTLDMLLEKVKMMIARQEATTMGTNSTSAVDGVSHKKEDQLALPSHGDVTSNPAMLLDDTNSIDVPNLFAQSSLNALGDIDHPPELNWALWDTEFHNQTDFAASNLLWTFDNNMMDLNQTVDSRAFLDE